MTTTSAPLTRTDRRLLALAAAADRRLADPMAGFVDLAGVREAVEELTEAFAPLGRVQHTVAAKACGLAPLLRFLGDLGIDAEVASPGETAVAEAAGLRGPRLVLDSPAKTTAELAHALAEGTAVNADSFQELARLDRLVGATPESVLGVRINPQVGAGRIGDTSTATTGSKFGIPLRDHGNRGLLLESFAHRPWLTRLHVHVGSQGCPPELMAEGVAAVHELAEEINAEAGYRQVTSLDLGGGLPVDFTSDEPGPTYAGYVATLLDRVPALADGRYAFVTEFGRSLLAKSGFLVSAVEYTKVAGGRHIAVTHAGGQVAARTVLQPEHWPLRIGAFDATGTPKTGPEVPQDIAGPLCFAGDLLARQRPLPLLEPGDLVVAHDTGAYYFGAHYAYNTLPRPAVYGFTVSPSGDVAFTPLRRAQTLAELVADAGGEFLGALPEA
ncbi:type III PLP-dependent enzyme domain-containing protein [Amycolatopsis rifamycinica]|uniref:Diaminopimelate decarboxylase n=1 Tax=Amycolatopsis rifamycinica TaxID=287986 RepID=A0A066U0K7_9PSEU|nr:diaminopimelate decarboxylase [Amycolatopsis rifamycinica]KDN20991.1 diaminopimelate decarboxylase [Amycolatopsis rifamycinica]